MHGYHALPRHFNLTTHFLDRNLETGRGGRTVLYCGGDAYSYAQLARLTNRAGHVLRELGVGPENRVLLALSDGPEFVASWYAVLKIGAVVGEVYTFLQPKEYEYYLNYSRARAVVVDSTTLESIREVAPRCPALRAILVVGDGAEKGNAVHEASFSELVATAPDKLSPADTTKDDIALWKFTTGSTGAPKAAVHLQHDPFISFEAYALGVLEMTEEDVVLPVPKLFFGYARDLSTLFTFGVGAAGVVFPERTTPERIFALIEQRRPTILVNVPTMMNQMIAHPEANSADLSSLRLNISSGEALPPALYEDWVEQFGVETLDGIGSSEAYHIYLSNRPGEVRPGSVGRLVPGYEGRLVDENGVDVPAGETGELWLRGESAAIMYWNEHQKSKQTFAGDWIYTGDRFRRDEGGYFWYQGRTDTLLKVGGIWISPLEIEKCLQGHPAVLECAVVGYEEDGLTLPRAYVVLHDPHAASANLPRTLQEYVRSNLSPYKYPRDVCVISSLPKTASGKVDRRALDELEEQERTVTQRRADHRIPPEKRRSENG